MISEIEQVMSYKTEDGQVFVEESYAIIHAGELKKEKKLKMLVKKIKQVFEPDLNVLKNITKEYDIGLEADFWNDKNSSLSGKISIDSFYDYVLLVKALLESLHLKKVVEIISKDSGNEGKKNE